MLGLERNLEGEGRRKDGEATPATQVGRKESREKGRWETGPGRAFVLYLPDYSLISNQIQAHFN